jgi:hypothetical protein
MEIENIALATERARARLNQMLIECVQTDFDAGGAEVLAWLRKDRPLEYLRLVRLALSPDDEKGGLAIHGETRSQLLSRIFARFR